MRHTGGQSGGHASGWTADLRAFGHHRCLGAGARRAGRRLRRLAGYCGCRGTAGHSPAHAGRRTSSFSARWPFANERCGVRMSSNYLAQVSEHLLAPGGLSLEQLPVLLGELAGPGVDAGDLYFQSQISESWMLEDGIVKEGSFNFDQGVGVRALAGEKTGFAYSNGIELPALRQATRAARSIARAGQQGRVQAAQVPPFSPLYAADNPLDVLLRADKVALLQRIDRATRALDPRVQQVTVSLAGVWERIL